MGAAPIVGAARRIRGILAPLAMAGCLSLLAACQAPPASTPAERAVPRHPIQPAGTDWARPPMTTVQAPDPDDPRRITPGPNSRVSPSPDMAPRVPPASRPDAPSSRQDVDELRRDLQQLRRRDPVEPGPPAGTIDRRPGTLRDTPGTIEVPR